MQFAVHCLKSARVCCSHSISKYMPFRMPAARLLYIAAKSIMTSLAKSYTNVLALFASYQNIDCLSLPFLSFSRTKSAEQNNHVSCWARCSLLIMCNSALDFFCFLFVLLHSTDALSVRIMPHTIRPERAALRWAEAYFHRLIAHTVKALCADCFKR